MYLEEDDKNFREGFLFQMALPFIFSLILASSRTFLFLGVDLRFGQQGERFTKFIFFCEKLHIYGP